MSIPDKDRTILWVRANGKCSICKMDLLQKADNESQTSIVGDNCHITAASAGGKRYDAALSDKERNSYPNLILLCKIHHKNIDDDINTYTVAKIHSIKAEHELWVESAFKNLAGPDANYMRLVELATDQLDLRNWDFITDNAIRNMVPDSFIEGVGKFGLEVHRAIWSNTRPDLEFAINELSRISLMYREKFLSKAALETKTMKWWREDQKWKEWFNPNYDEDLQKSEKWSGECQNLLFDLTVAINRFGDAVRAGLKSDFMVSYGRFGVSDSHGYSNQMEPVVYFPTKYRDET